MLNSNKKLVTFLIDSGSDVSILKINILNLSEFIQTNNSVKLHGITSNAISTLGTYNAQLQFNDILIEQTCFVVTAAFPISQDGLLGRDFLRKTTAVLDYGCNSVQLFGKLNYPFNAYFHEVIEPPILSQIEIDMFQVRFEKLIELLKIDINKTNKQLGKIIYDFNHIFYIEGDLVSYTNTVEHKIELIPGSMPINIKQYRVAEAMQIEMETQVQKMLTEGIIQRSCSPYNAPLVLVKKKTEDPSKLKWRLCVDYRKLNEITVNVASPVPRISEILDRLGRSVWYSTLDLASGYFQVLMREEDRCKTAFSFRNHHFEFLRMPFGLKNSPFTFIHLINQVVEGLENVLVYLDDLIIFAESIEQHNSVLLAVFERLQMHHLALQPEKCKFLLTEINYLGHKITREGITIQESNIKAVKSFPIPKTVKQVRSFLGFANYYRDFIPNFAEKAKPLTNLTKKGIKFEWSPECQQAMVYFTDQITSSPILQPPDFTKEFILSCDASTLAIAGVLSQAHNKMTDKPVGFFSRGLFDAETRYSTIELEMLAIVAAIRHFRVYLLCHRFCIITDHNPLVYIRSSPNQNSRLLRWRLDLEEYDFYVKHKPGILNTNADYLSRIIVVDNQINQKNNVRIVTRAQSKKIKNNTEMDIASLCTIAEDIEESSQTDLFEKLGPYSKEEIVEDEEMVIVLGVSPLNISFEKYAEFINENPISNLKVKELKEKLPVKHINYLVEFISADEGNLKTIEEETDEEEEFIPEVSIEQTKLGPILVLTINKSVQSTICIEILFKALQLLIQFCVNKKIEEIIVDLSTEKIFPLEYRVVLNIIKFLTKDQNLVTTVYQCEVEKILFTDHERIKEILLEFHGSPLAGHQGRKRTLHKIRQHFYWEGMTQDVIDYVSKCVLCQKTKRHGLKFAPMRITTTAKVPFEILSLDIVGKLVTSFQNNSYLLTIQDDLTRYLIAVPLENQTATEVAKALTENVFLIYSAPLVIRSDQGSNFMSEVFKETCKFWNSKKIRTTSYFPQGNGTLERSHAVIKDYLRTFVNHEPALWDEWIKAACFCYNTTIHGSTGFTPFELLFGFKARLPSGVQKPPEIVYNYENYVIDLKNKLQNSYLIARDNLIKTKETTKKRFDQKAKSVNFNVGDHVLLRKGDSGLGHKELTGRFVGPFTIEQVPSPENCVIRVGRKLQRVHINRLKLFLEDETND